MKRKKQIIVWVLVLSAFFWGTAERASAAPSQGVPDFALGGPTDKGNAIPTIGAQATSSQGLPDVPPVHKKMSPSPGNDIPLPDLSSPPAPQEDSGNSQGQDSGFNNVSGVYRGVSEKDAEYMAKLIQLRKRIILDILEKRAGELEKQLGKLTPAQKTVRISKIAAEAAKKKKAEGPKDHGIVVFGIHDDRVFVSYGGRKKWIVLGTTIMGGKYRLSSVTEKTATFEEKDGKKFTITEAPRVIPRPSIAVKSVSGQTATIVYRGDSYTVTLNSPIGDDLTVTALTTTNFAVTDSHGRTFSYPVPQSPVAKGPGQPGGFMPPPPPPYGYGQPGGTQGGSGSAEDSNY